MNISLLQSALLLTLLTALPASAQEAATPASEKVTYADHVQALLKRRCGSCHNANEKKGSLSIESYASIMEGGSSGAVIEPGDSGSSYLFMLVSHQEEPKMPPNADKLPDTELALIKKWIDLGALENSGSTANIKKKPALAKVDVTGTRPENVAYPLTFLGDPAVSPSSFNAVTALAVSPWASLVAVSGHHQIGLYNSQSLQSLGALAYPEGQPQVFKFTRSGDLLLVGGGRGGASGKVVVFDVRTGERKIEVGDEYDTVLAADISPDQTQIALGGPKKIVRVYSTESGELLYEQKKHTDWVTAIEFSPDGVLLASGDRSNGLVVWEAYSGNLFYDLVGHKAAITDVSWRGDSNVLASCSEDGNIQLWEMQNGTSIKNWGAHGGGVSAVEYTREGQLVSTGRDRNAALWNGDGAKVRDFGGLTDIGMEVAFDAESKRVLAGDWTGVIRIWNADDAAQLGVIDTNPPSLDEQLSAVQSQFDATSLQAQSAMAAFTTARDEIQARRQSAEDLARTALAAMQQVDKTRQLAADAKTAAETRQTTLTMTATALQQAEQALAAAKAAHEAATREQQQAQQAATTAVAALEQAVQAEQAATATAAQAKESAEKALAAAKVTDEQAAALQAAEAAAAQAQALLSRIQEQLKFLLQARDLRSQTAAK